MNKTIELTMLKVPMHSYLTKIKDEIGVEKYIKIQLEYMLSQWGNKYETEALSICVQHEKKIDNYPIIQCKKYKNLFRNLQQDLFSIRIHLN